MDNERKGGYGPPPQQQSNTNYSDRIVSEGSHLANIIGIYDIGQQENRYKNDGTTSYKIAITFEVMNETYEFEKDNVKQQAKKVITKEMTYIYSAKSFLLKIVEAAIGKKLTSEEISGDSWLSPREVLGMPVMINVVHKPNQKYPDQPFANVDSVMKPIQGAILEKHQRSLQFYTVRDNFSSLGELEKQEDFIALNSFIKGKVKKSIEYLELMDIGTTQQTGSEPQTYNSVD